MKIVYIYPALSTIGGADRVIVDKANYFAEKCGYEVYIVTAHQNGQNSFFSLSGKVNHIDLNVNFNEQYNHNFFARGFIYLMLISRYRKRLSKLLHELKADFTITTISRDIDFIHTIKDGSIKIAEAHSPKHYLRNLHRLQFKNWMYQISGKIFTRKLEKAAKKFAAFVVLTQNDADCWKDIRPCTVIPNSLPFFPEKASNCQNKLIITVGRLYPEKGYERLIEAWAMVSPKHPDWKVRVYGVGILKDPLNKLIRKKGVVDTFFLEGATKNISEKYLESSFYIMGSIFEGFGMVLIEAMACGLPVIAFDCPVGPATIIKNQEDGFLVKNGDIEQFAQKICYLIENDEARIQMGEKARANVQRFNRELIMQKWIDLFQSLKESKN